MKFNYENTDNCLWLCDEWGMITRRKLPWEEEPEICNRGDAMVNNSLSMIAFENNDEMLEGLSNCIDWTTEELPYFWRHPRFKELREEGKPTRDETSRDQVTMMIIALVMDGQKHMLEWVLNRLKWRISWKFTQDIPMWLWQKSIKHSSKWIASVWYLLMVPWMLFTFLQNKILFSLAGIKDKTQEEYRPTNKSSLTRFQKWVVKENVHFPQYVIYKLVWQWYIVPKVPILRWVIKKLLLIQTEKTNYVDKMLLGKYVPFEDITSYKPMTGYRWASRLNETSSQTDFTDKTENLMDVAMLRKVYSMVHKHRFFVIRIFKVDVFSYWGRIDGVFMCFFNLLYFRYDPVQEPIEGMDKEWKYYWLKRYRFAFRIKIGKNIINI